MGITFPLPPGGPLEVVFSFDTTGSMYSYLDEIRGRIQDMIQRLQADIPGIKIAVLAHGDYCDAETTYVTKWVDFSSDIAKLCDFVKNVEPTYGGDAPECYELVLREVGTKLSWTPNSRRVLVLIGDDNPHEKHDPCNKNKIDWKEETKTLATKGVTIYGVQCGTSNVADLFFKTISLATQGKHLKLQDFGSLFDVLMAVCYREGNDTAMLTCYEKEVRARCGDAGLARDIDVIFNTLRDETAVDFDAESSSSSGSDKTKDVTSKKSVIKASLRTTASRIPTRSRKPPKQMKLDRFKQRNLPLLKRENVPENNFSLRSLTWSPWTLAVVPSKEQIPNVQNSLWEKRLGKPGYRIKSLPKRKCDVNSKCLFEVSVQGQSQHSRRHIVFNCFSARSVGTLHWEKRLLRKSKCQLDRVLGLGCKVYIRYCPMGQQAEIPSVRKDLKRYDYAWRKVRKMRARARDVVKGGVSISKADI